MPTIKEAMKRLHYHDGQHVAVAIWCEDDVLERAKERGIRLTREQAQGVLANMDYKQDCSMGITWDTMDVYLDEVASETE